MAKSSPPRSATLRAVLQSASELPPTKGGWRVSDALEHLLAAEPRFAALIERHGVPSQYVGWAETAPPPPFFALMRTIVYQQLAGKAAASIMGKVMAALGLGGDGGGGGGAGGDSARAATPADVLAATFTRGEVEGKTKVLLNGVPCGLSWAKAGYIRSLAEHFGDPARLGGTTDFGQMSDGELFAKLVAVKGLGAWSVHMHMMFALHRPDVLPTGDLAVRKGVVRLHGLTARSPYAGKVTVDGKGVVQLKDDRAGRERMKALCAGWSPYASVGSFYMWRMQDTAVLVPSSSPSSPPPPSTSSPSHSGSGAAAAGGARAQGKGQNKARTAVPKKRAGKDLAMTVAAKAGGSSAGSGIRKSTRKRAKTEDG